jgi:hypothetical protein
MNSERHASTRDDPPRSAKPVLEPIPEPGPKPAPRPTTIIETMDADADVTIEARSDNAEKSPASRE